MEDDDIRGDIEAALKELESGADSAPKETSTPAPEGPARDERGRFAAKETNEPASEEPETGASAPAETPTIRMPASLKPELKARWEQLDPDVQAELVRREEEVQSAKSEWDKKANRYNQLDAVISPVRERIALAGTTEDQYIRQLIAADEILRSNPEVGLREVARMYGVHPSQLNAVMQQQAAEQQYSQGYHPVIDQLEAKVQQLIDHINQQQYAEEERANADLQAHIDAFKSDPAHRYFEDVRPLMAALFSAGQVTDLKTAYDMAVYADPKIRALIQQERVADDKAKAAAAKAKAAGGSVTGAPGSGQATAAKSASPRTSIREDIEAAIASLST